MLNCVVARVAAAVVAAGIAGVGWSQTVAPSDRLMTPAHVFELEYASDPQAAPAGSAVVFVRHSGDIMTDRFRPSIWRVDRATGATRPVVTGPGSYTTPRWDPEGLRLLYVAAEDGRHELRVLYLDTLETLVVCELPEAPRHPAWSPDGRSIAFTMFVPGSAPASIELPEKPDGATWADAPVVIDETIYKRDGSGEFVRPGAVQVFVVDAEGGTPAQVTDGESDMDGPLAWTPRGRTVVLSANPSPDAEFDPLESDLFEVDMATGAMRRLTDRDGPDASPVISPDGSRIAYTGFDDREQGFQVTRLYVLEPRTGERVTVSERLDRSMRAARWSADGTALYALYHDRGVGRIARFELDGTFAVVAEDIGGTTLGRPYGGGSFTLAPDGSVVTVVTDPTRPADVAVFPGDGMGPATRLTRLNEDVLGRLDLAEARSITVPSSHDGLEIEAWVLRPPNFREGARYPMILEIHGGPFADYGPRFSGELQLFAAAGYIVVYANPRGSTSYGEAFGNAIHHAYPGHDYDDLMSVVDAVLASEPVDPARLFVTGGSGGGVLTAWIVGKTDRFSAAVVAKPVINWASFVLTADAYPFFTKYWFPAMPWEDPQHYWDRSPLSLVGQVTTPTMLLTGEIDYRTPMSETEQYYQALRLAGVQTRLVRIPGAAHGIASRPSRLAGKVSAILGWFERHDPSAEAGADSASSAAR